MSIPTADPYRLLVVDDEEEILVSTSALLRRQGYQAFVASSGEEALRLLAQHDPQLMLVDYHMPHMSGPELIRQVRRTNPFLQIVLHTGYSDEAPPQKIITELDIQGYHDKGDGPDKLLTWVAAGLRTYHLIERLHQHGRMQGELMANVSHELHTPLNILSGYAEMLLDGHFGDVADGMAKPLRSIRDASLNLTSLVANFLQQTKVDAGFVEVDKRPIDLAEFAEEISRLGSFLVESRDIVFDVARGGSMDRIESDPIKLRTIARNLVTNAAKFTKAGQISVQLQANPAELSIAVRDTGAGIAAEDLSRIFDIFRQGSSRNQPTARGIGLGLALSRRYARLLGGDIEVTSCLGQGSLFSARIPLPR